MNCDACDVPMKYTGIKKYVMMQPFAPNSTPAEMHERELATF